MNHKKIVVFGATGFVGKVLVQHLAKQGAVITAPTRRPGLATFLKPLGEVGQITPLFCDVADIDSIDTFIQGADAVINLVGVGFEKGFNTFEGINVKAAGAIAAACARHHVARLIHVSALVNDGGDCAYACSKGAGEDAVHKAFPGATILQPSLVFGLESPFFNIFSNLSQISPVFHIFERGDTLFQPFHVGD